MVPVLNTLGTDVSCVGVSPQSFDGDSQTLTTA